MMGNRGVVKLRDRSEPVNDWRVALLVMAFIIGLFLGIVVGLTMQPEEKTPYYLPPAGSQEG